MNENQRIVLRSIIADLETIMNEEQDKYDNAPENLQDTEKISKYEEDADQLQEAIDVLESIVED